MHSFFPSFHSGLGSKRLLWYTEAPSESAPAVTAEKNQDLTGDSNATKKAGQEAVKQAEKEALLASLEFQNTLPEQEVNIRKQVAAELIRLYNEPGHVAYGIEDIYHNWIPEAGVEDHLALLESVWKRYAADGGRHGQVGRKGKQLSYFGEGESVSHYTYVNYSDDSTGFLKGENREQRQQRKQDRQALSEFETELRKKMKSEGYSPEPYRQFPEAYKDYAKTRAGKAFVKGSIISQQDHFEFDPNKEKTILLSRENISADREAMDEYEKAIARLPKDPSKLDHDLVEDMVKTISAIGKVYEMNVDAGYTFEPPEREKEYRANVERSKKLLARLQPFRTSEALDAEERARVEQTPEAKPEQEEVKEALVNPPTYFSPPIEAEPEPSPYFNDMGLSANEQGLLTNYAQKNGLTGANGKLTPEEQQVIVRSFSGLQIDEILLDPKKNPAVLNMVQTALVEHRSNNNPHLANEPKIAPIQTTAVTEPAALAIADDENPVATATPSAIPAEPEKAEASQVAQAGQTEPANPPKTEVPAAKEPLPAGSIALAQVSSGAETSGANSESAVIFAQGALQRDPNSNDQPITASAQFTLAEMPESLIYSKGLDSVEPEKDSRPTSPVEPDSKPTPNLEEFSVLSQQERLEANLRLSSYKTLQDLKEAYASVELDLDEETIRIWKEVQAEKKAKRLREEIGYIKPIPEALAILEDPTLLQPSPSEKIRISEDNFESLPYQDQIKSVFAQGIYLGDITEMINKRPVGYAQGEWMDIIDGLKKRGVAFPPNQPWQASRDIIRIQMGEFGLQEGQRVRNFFNEHFPPFGPTLEKSEIDPNWNPMIRAIFTQILSTQESIPTELALNFMRAYGAIDPEKDLKIEPSFYANKFKLTTAVAFFNELIEKKATTVHNYELIAGLLRWQEAQINAYKKTLEKTPTGQYRLTLSALAAAADLSDTKNTTPIPTQTPEPPEPRSQPEVLVSNKIPTNDQVPEEMRGVTTEGEDGVGGEVVQQKNKIDDQEPDFEEVSPKDTEPVKPLKIKERTGSDRLTLGGDEEGNPLLS